MLAKFGAYGMMHESDHRCVFLTDVCYTAKFCSSSNYLCCNFQTNFIYQWDHFVARNGNNLPPWAECQMVSYVVVFVLTAFL